MCQAFDGLGARSVCGMPAGNRRGIGRAMGRGARISARACPLLVGILLLGPRIAGAQDELPNYRKPILTVETGGHHARVRSILWHDDATLLTAGEDKVVKVWDVRAEGRLIRSIRPPIWRGPAGTIYAMAETRPDPRGQSFLAVGGYGVEARRGDITVYRFPELDPAPGRDVRIPTGDVAARLLPPPDVPPGQIGHRQLGPVPGVRPGREVARLGEPGQDGDPLGASRVPSPPRPAAAIRPMSAPSPSAPTAGAWPPRAGTGRSASGTSTAASCWTSGWGTSIPIARNALAFSPDGRWIVVGSENSDLFRFDSQGLARIPHVQFPTLPTQGPVEALAISSDGTPAGRLHQERQGRQYRPHDVLERRGDPHHARREPDTP